MRIRLPRNLDLHCPACGSCFTIPAKSLNNRPTVTCPLCSAKFNIYDGLSSLFRRKTYHVIRNHLEKLIYGLYREHNSDMSDGWNESVPAEEPPSE